MKKVNDLAKKVDANRLVSVTCLKENDGFVIYYHFSKDDKQELMELRIDVASGEEVESMIPLYANAELLEAEVTELYGVKFHGNPASGKRLFLEEK